MKKLLSFIALCLAIHASSFAQASISGTIKTTDNDEIGNVSVSIFDNNGNLMSQAQASGSFSFSNLTAGESYLLVFEKDTDPQNGVSTFDLVIHQRHILGISTLDSPYKMFAADVNDSQTITVFDAVLMRKLILAINDELPSPSWQFLPANIPATPNPFGYTYNEILVTMDSTNETVEIIGFKMGDLNSSANPD